MFQSKSFIYEKELHREILLRNYSFTTYKNYKSHLRRLSEFFSLDLKGISIDQLKLYLYHLTSVRKLGANSVNTCRSAFIFFSNAVIGKPINPLLIPHLKPLHKLPIILSTTQIIDLLQSIKNLKHRAILSLCYGSGLRISEALHLRISDIHSDDMSLLVFQGKGRKDRFSILSQYSLDLLRLYYKSWKPKGPFLFEHIYPQNIQQAFRIAVSNSNFSKYGKITTHTLRHSFATHLLDTGCDLYTIKTLLGHKSLNSTCIYLQLTHSHFSALVSPIDRKDGDSLVF